ncbi:MAG: undecaprenyl-diphosphate phosphatase [Microbacteriaceae bacterium]
MSFIEAIILGLVQGLTEFLPISSSAHLRITGLFLPSATDPGATFTAITQIGTEIAVLLYFWKDISRIISKWFQALFGKIPKNDQDVRLGWLIIIGTIPIVAAGYFLQDLIRDNFRSLWLVAIVLIVFGILLGLVDWIMPKVKTLKSMSWGDGLLYGVSQTLALVPGVSRSGATITMGRALGYERSSAARFAFLLAVPAVFGSGLYELVKSTESPQVYGGLETLVATLVAFAVGYLVIAFLMRYIEKRSFMPFVIYRILLGGTLLVLLGMGIISD